MTPKIILVHPKLGLRPVFCNCRFYYDEDWKDTQIHVTGLFAQIAEQELFEFKYHTEVI